MLRRPDGRLRGLKIRLKRLVALEAAMQDRVEAEIGQPDDLDLVPGFARALGVAVAQCLAKAALARVADDDGNLADGAGLSRLQFNQTDSDNDNTNDALILSDMKLIVKYES